MKLIRSLHNIQTEHQSCVATIGNFDGIHPGHIKVIDRVIELAHQYQRPSCVISFEPLPHEFFAGESGPARLCNLRTKYHLLAQTGIDQLLILPFNQKLASQMPELFIHNVLLNGLNVRHLIVGDDFRFGYKRLGDYQLLKEVGHTQNMLVEPTQTVMRDNLRISSTRIRKKLESHEIADVSTLLNRPFSLSGRIAHGDKIGRTIGFPTINVLHKHRRLPIQGAYVVKATIEGGPSYFGMANAGVRPTVNGIEPRFEVHLFDFNQSVYGKVIDVEILSFLRPEQKFTSIDGLIAMLAKDKHQAQLMINNENF